MRREIVELLNSGKFTSFHAVIAMIKIKRNVDVKIQIDGTDELRFGQFLQDAVESLFGEFSIIILKDRSGVILKYY